MATHHKFSATRTAHVYTIGEADNHIKKVWIVTHGYGQLASRFIHRFAQLEDGETLIIAPEGLSRFYWGGFTGEVVSSWMTSGDRLDEIADFSNYMQQVYETFIPQLREEVTINLLGFSQGCATQVRWILREFPRFDNLVIWSGSMPEDIPYHEKAGFWDNKKLFFVYGTADPFLTEKRVKWCYDVIAEKGLTCQTFTFDGKHEVDKVALREFVEQFL
ncbi:MAG: phospholipase [Bacteroidota bacterium]